MFLSLSVSPPFSLSLKSVNVSSGEDLKNETTHSFNDKVQTLSLDVCFFPVQNLYLLGHSGQWGHPQTCNRQNMKCYFVFFPHVFMHQRSGGLLLQCFSS